MWVKRYLKRYHRLKRLKQRFHIRRRSHLPCLLASLMIGNVHDLQRVANLPAYHQPAKRDLMLISKPRQSLHFRPSI